MSLSVSNWQRLTVLSKNIEGLSLKLNLLLGKIRDLKNEVEDLQISTELNAKWLSCFLEEERPKEPHS
jgi:hypothetical protein